MPEPTTHANEVSTIGTFNYMAPEVASSLYRNGEVLTRRDADGSDSGRVGIHLESRAMPVHNARSRGGAQMTVERHGFELLSEPLSTPELDFFSHADVIAHYYPDCARLVQQATGAAQIYAFDHNIRSAEGKSKKARISGGQQVQGPAHIVHGDYTLTSAPQRLCDLARPATQNDTLHDVLAGEPLIGTEMVEAVQGGTRFSIINVWRNIAIEPVLTHPLALCDALSVVPEDLVVFEIHYADRIGENYFAKHSDRHQWYFYPSMVRDEALLIKQWDSAGAFAKSKGAQRDHIEDSDDPCTFSFHSAFDDPDTPADAPDRWSIEVRCIAIYP